VKDGLVDLIKFQGIGKLFLKKNTTYPKPIDMNDYLLRKRLKNYEKGN
jgi:hypothetical protein